MKIAIGIATTGRPAVVGQAVERLLRQTRPADMIVVVGATPADIAALPEGVDGSITQKGLCRQRNRIMEIVSGEADVLVFLDDDYVATASFVAGVERIFSEHPQIAGATGHVIDDGVTKESIQFDAADRLAEAYEAEPRGDYTFRPAYGAYGCNMAFRLSVTEGLTFDENLPLYGWQEDTDFSRRLAQRGQLVKTDAFAGIHLGSREGRSPGKRLGYSQVVNPIYLVRKGTMTVPFAMSLVGRNLIANLVKSVAPEPHIDRKGRLVGNLMGFAEIAQGRAHPKRILDIAS